MPPPRTSLTRKTAKITLVAVAITALMLLAAYVAKFLLLVFAGVLVSVLLSTLATQLSKRSKLNYSASLAVVVIGLLALAGLATWLLAPIISKQAEELAQELPRSLQKLKAILERTVIGEWLLQNMPKKSGELLSGGEKGASAMKSISGAVASTLGLVADAVIITVTGIYLAVDPAGYKRSFVRLFMPSYRPRLEQVLEKCHETLIAWLITISITMCIIGVASGIGLALLGIPLAVILGVIAALFNFIPNLGPFFSLVPATLLGLMESPEKAFFVILLFIGLQSLEGYVLTPLLEKKMVSIPPAVLLFGQVLLGLLFGFAGLVLAAPLIAVLRVLVEELYVKDYVEKGTSKENSE